MELNKFINYKVDGVNVYIQKNVKINTNVLKFKLSSTFFVKSIVAIGLKINSL
ncbi:hypothetical protein [Helicovermis profundi]|uniref:hypothetical protein n=1 Tax=Helicovermis profundi TaxID=3065157 RepID=UPI0030D1D29C